MTGSVRFEYYLNQVQELLYKSEKEENPAYWLFTNGLRTPMFMLEALAKLYSKLHNKDLFNKLQDKFKQLEDVLGDIDYYNVYENEYKNRGDIAQDTLIYFHAKKEKHLGLLNNILKDEKWIGDDAGRIDKIRKKLKKANWLPEYDEMIAIKGFYDNAIGSIKDFYAGIKGPFNDMEKEVHEIRRKLRWLSIYPQALRGSIQLSGKLSPEPHIEKYLTPEVVNSPFNKLPDPAGNPYILMLEKNYFLALSWLIAELGKLKDAGLGLIALETAFNHNRDKKTRLLQEANLAGKPGVQDYMHRASEITKTFFQEKNLEKLVGDVILIGAPTPFTGS